VGLALVLAGVVMLLGGRIPIRLPGVRGTRAATHSGWRLVGFGAGYALASASCTLAIVLAVVTQAVTAETFPGIVAVFLANAAGSALVLLALAVAAALANTALPAVLGRVARYLPRVSGALLAASGAYLLMSWLPHLDGSAPTQRSGLDPASAQATIWISSHQGLVATIGLILIAVAALAASLTLRRSPRPEDYCDTTTPDQACADEPATTATPAG
jgi:cytochrome c-type biogenesis protein